MSRIECETAEQCEQLAEATQALIEPTITAILVGAVVLMVGMNIYRVVKDDGE